MWLLLLTVLGPPLAKSLYSPWECCPRLYEFTCESDLLYLEDLCFLACLHFLYLLWFLCLLFEFPETKREEFDESIPFKTMNSKVSHTLCNVWLWVSVFVPCTAGGSSSDEGWAGLYKYSRMFSEVLLFLCSFRRTVVFGFPVGPFQSQVLCHPNVLGMGMGSVSWKGP